MDLLDSGGAPQAWVVQVFPIYSILNIYLSFNKDYEYEWIEWQMQLQQKFSSTIILSPNNIPLEISCAYSGRVAVAYVNNDSKTPDSSQINISVDIYECESTGKMITANYIYVM